MADRNYKSKENLAGKYYVDESCIVAKFCVAVAPKYFKISDDGHAYVSKQPQTPEEEKQVQEALLGCPVGAIGDDGLD